MSTNEDLAALRVKQYEQALVRANDAVEEARNVLAVAMQHRDNVIAALRDAEGAA